MMPLASRRRHLVRTLVLVPVDESAHEVRELVVVNPHSGAGGDLPDALAGLPSTAPDDLEHAIDQLNSEGHPLRVIVWGGDGTMRTAARVVVGTDTTLLPAPAGTHNHFAQHVGITNLEEFAVAREANVVRRLDVGYVNDEIFLNNANVGWYVELVRRRERYERRVPRRLAKIASTLLQTFRTHRIALEVDGVAVVAWMVWVGNGRFILEPTRLAEREELRDGVLDVRVLPVREPFSRARAVIALLRREAGDHPSLLRWTATRVEIQPRGEAHRVMRVACDGEVVELMPALRFRVEPAVLATVVSPDRA
jgi:undecaprenyl-diphosphatase